MEAFSALLSLCEGNPPVTGLDGSFDVGLHEVLNKQSSGWWFETPEIPVSRIFDVSFDVSLNKEWLVIWDAIKFSVMSLNCISIEHQAF